jgi:hypothetical protein
VGDSGYVAGQPGIFDRVVDDMNRFPLAFVVHDGDFKDPQSPCGDDRFESVRASFDRSVAPFVYTPGDNEWMDCATARTPMDPLQRLGELREMFFAADESRGVNRMPLTTQRQSGYPENARWTKEGVVFVTINAPGPNDDVANADESNARRTANVAWLQAAFDAAEATAAPGVMVVWQVDPWQPLFRKTWTYLLDVLKARTVAFGKPVVLVHGDTHVYRIDKGGWADGDGTMQHAWTGVSNFTRVETYASGVASPQSSTPPEPKRWIRATVDPSDPAVFTFTTETAG